MLESLWEHFGITLRSLVTLSSLRGYFVVTLGKWWGHCGVTLGYSVRNVVGSFWGRVEIILESFWKCSSLLSA